MLVISLCGIILDEFSKVLILSESFLNLFVLFVSLFTLIINSKDTKNIENDEYFRLNL